MDQHLNEILENSGFGIPKFLEQWQEWGAGVQEDVYKFFCYYTAFNFLYNSWEGSCRGCNLFNPFLKCKYQVRENLNGKMKIEYTEKCKICNTIRNIIEEATDFNPFQTGILKSDAKIIVRPVKAIQTQSLAPEVVYGECTCKNTKISSSIYIMYVAIYIMGKRPWKLKEIRLS